MAWDMYDERAHVENLVSARLNFLVVFYSVIIAGAIAARTQIEQTIVCALGASIVTLTAITVHRAHAKLDTILEILHEDEPGPFRVTHVGFRDRWF